MPDNEQSQSLRPEIDQIINSGQQAAPSGGLARSVAACGLLSGGLLWLCFTPVDFAAAAWVAIVPLCVLCRIEQLPKYAYRMLAVTGFLWAVCTLQWMRLGHVTMYGALAALSFYIALYFPVFVAVSRSLTRARIPVWLAVPVAWTALEYLRAWVFTGFSWYYLGHSQYQWTSLVQIADITGAYGVSFLIALAAAAVAECIPAGWLVRCRLTDSADKVSTPSGRSLVTAVSVSAGLIVASCVYGAFRTQPASGDGPTIAVVQGNFTPELKHDSTKWLRMWMDHSQMTRTAATLRPDLIVWPETMFPEPDVVIEKGVEDADLVSRLDMPGSMSNSAAAQNIIDRWRDQQARKLLADLSKEAGAALMIGLITEQHDKDSNKRFNSAALIRPTTGYVDRYDKMHRVIFGEYIPLRDVLPWLAKLTPFGAGFGIDAGKDPVVFEHSGARFAPVICFEDTVPHLVRDAVNATDESGNTPDVLVNMTNDGWFRGSSELDQHLITATFRCIETRRPMVRAVNCGISAFIDSSGRIRDPEHFLLLKEDESGAIADFERVESMIDPETNQRYRQCSAVMSGQLPLDGRDTLYLQFGDWFAVLCSMAAVAGVVFSRLRSRRPEPEGGGEPSMPLTQAA